MQMGHQTERTARHNRAKGRRRGWAAAGPWTQTKGVLARATFADVGDALEEGKQVWPEEVEEAEEEDVEGCESPMGDLDRRWRDAAGETTTHFLLLQAGAGAGAADPLGSPPRHRASGGTNWA